MSRTYSIAGLLNQPRRHPSRIVLPTDKEVYQHGACGIGCGCGMGVGMRQAPGLLDSLQALSLWDTSYSPPRPNLLGVYLLAPPWIDLDVSRINSPTVFNAGAPWTLNNITFSDANTFVETAGVPAMHYMSSNLAGHVASYGPATIWYDVEPNGRTVCCISHVGNAYFDLSGVGAILGVPAGCTASIAELTSEGHPGRYRCAITVPIASPIGGLYLYAYNGSLTYAGDVTKGLKVFVCGITQSSISRARNLFGGVTARAVADGGWGDAFDLAEAVKSAQPVFGASTWNGSSGCGIFSAANKLVNAAVAVPFAGSDKPIGAAVAYQHTAATAEQTRWALNSEAANPRYHERGYSGGLNNFYRRSDAGGADSVTLNSGASNLNRHCRVTSFSGTELTTLLDGAAELTAQAMNVGDMTVNRIAVGAVTSGAYPGTVLAGSGMVGNIRMFVLMRNAPTAAQATMLDRLVRAHAGGI